MIDTDRESIDGLSHRLQEIFDSFTESYRNQVEYAYGADDVLVIIAHQQTDDDAFIQAVGSTLTDATVIDSGFMISHGGGEYENHTAAYIRHEPPNAYEYVLPLCSRFDLSSHQRTHVFKKVHEQTGDEGTDAIQTATGYIYALVPKEVSIKKLAQLTDVAPQEVRQHAIEANEQLDS